MSGSVIVCLSGVRLNYQHRVGDVLIVILSLSLPVILSSYILILYLYIPYPYTISLYYIPVLYAYTVTFPFTRLFGSSQPCLSPLYLRLAWLARRSSILRQRTTHGLTRNLAPPLCSFWPAPFFGRGCLSGRAAGSLHFFSCLLLRLLFVDRC